MSSLRRILLASDNLSPNSGPHSLPALFWFGLFSSSSSSDIRSALEKSGWSPQWTYGMYKEAHYHSSSHELLSVIAGSATILLGGTDDLAEKLRSKQEQGSKSDSWELLDLKKGDVLLLPAGYSHRAMEDRDGFSMIGSYPKGMNWDMCYPGTSACQKGSKTIEKLIKDTARKGLGKADDPSGGDALSAWGL